MAILTSKNLAEIRKRLSKIASSPDYTKEEINDALQATEDWFEANRASLSSAIDVGTAHSFTNPEKKFIVAYWLLQKAFREESS